MIKIYTKQILKLKYFWVLDLPIVICRYSFQSKVINLWFERDNLVLFLKNCNSVFTTKKDFGIQAFGFSLMVFKIRFQLHIWIFLFHWEHFKQYVKLLCSTLYLIHIRLTSNQNWMKFDWTESLPCVLKSNWKDCKG